jgi:hypothetical protein
MDGEDGLPGGTMRRFSIRTLMAVIVIAALAMAALKNANAFLSGILLLVTLAVIGFAMLGATTMRGRQRHWWRGFALFSGCYLALALGPLPRETFRPLLGTTHLLGQLHERMHPAMVQVAENLITLQFERKKKTSYRESLLSRTTKSDPTILGLQGQLISLDQQIAALKSGATYDQFQQAGHSLFALLSGLLGGTVAVWFYARCERARPVNGAA